MTNDTRLTDAQRTRIVEVGIAAPTEIVVPADKVEAIRGLGDWDFGPAKRVMPDWPSALTIAVARELRRTADEAADYDAMVASQRAHHDAVDALHDADHGRRGPRRSRRIVNESEMGQSYLADM